MCVSTSLFLWQLKAAHGWVWTTVYILTNTDGAGASARRGATSSIGTGRSLYTTPAETGTVVHSGKLTNTTGTLTAVCRETTTFAKWPRFGCFTLYIEIGKFCFFTLPAKMLPQYLWFYEILNFFIICRNVFTYSFYSFKKMKLYILLYLLLLIFFWKFDFDGFFRCWCSHVLIPKIFFIFSGKAL